MFKTRCDIIHLVVPRTCCSHKSICKVIYNKFCYMGVSKLSQGCSKDVPRLFHGCSKGAPRVFQGCFKVVLNMFLGCIKWFTREFQGWFRGVSWLFSGYFNGVLRLFLCFFSKNDHFAYIKLDFYMKIFEILIHKCLMPWGYVPLCTRWKQKKTYFGGRQNDRTRVGLLYMYKKVTRAQRWFKDFYLIFDRFNT